MKFSIYLNRRVFVMVQPFKSHCCHSKGLNWNQTPFLFYLLFVSSGNLDKFCYLQTFINSAVYSFDDLAYVALKTILL